MSNVEQMPTREGCRRGKQDGDYGGEYACVVERRVWRWVSCDVMEGDGAREKTLRQ